MDFLLLGRSFPFGRRSLAAVVAVLFVVGCAGHRQAPEPLSPPDSAPVHTELTSARVRFLLEEQLAAWQGVPYRHGGQSRKGVDCSGFVQLTFRDQFGLVLPRTTEELAGIGLPLGRAELVSGDLVFFTTGGAGRHVGIVVDGLRFIHASSTRGVTQSSLAAPYWKRRFRQGRRVLGRQSQAQATAASE